MDSPSPAPVPDPYATASAQTQVNDNAARLQAELSRYNQVTPYGSLTWSHGTPTFDQTGYDAAMAAWNAAHPGTTTGGTTTTGDQNRDESDYTGLAPGTTTTGGTTTNGTTTSGDGAPDRNNFMTGGDDWTSTINLDPRIQQLVDSYISTQQGLSDATSNALQNVNNVFSHPIDYSALPSAGDAAGSLASARAQFYNLNPAIQGAEKNSAGASDILSKAEAQWDPSKLSYDSVDPLWKPSDATRQQVTDALYGQYTRQLDPRFSQQENQLRSTLANRGLVEGSEAWNSELGNFERSRNDAYNQADTSAITGSTAQMRDLFDQSLAARQEGVSEANALWQAPQTQAKNAADLATSAQGLFGNLVGLQDSQINSAYSDANTAFGMQNTQRQNALTEQEQQRVMALQWLASLQGGSMPPMPSFSPPSGPNVTPSNLSGDIYNSYTAQQNNNNASTSSNNATMGSFASIAAAAIAAF